MAQSAKKKDQESYLWLFRIGVGFILLSALLFLIGFATDHWHKDSVTNYGLWEGCQRGTCRLHDQDSLSGYHIATQALQIIAAIVYTLSPVLHFCLYCCKKKKSRDCRTRIFDVGFSIGIVFHFASVLIFGLTLPESLSWSYNMSAAAVGLGVVGIVLITTSRNEALRVLKLLPGGGSKHRNSRVGALLRSTSSSSSRAQTPQSATSRTSDNVIRSTRHQHVQRQRSIHEEIHTASLQPEPAFFTASSRVPYASTSTSPASNINYPHLNHKNPFLQHIAISSTSTPARLAPLRPQSLNLTPSAPHLLDQTV